MSEDNANSQRTRLIGAIPWLACTDVSAAIAFFESRLGFVREWTWGDPPTDGGVKRDGVRLYFMQNAELSERSKDSEVTITVEDVDALYAEHQSSGAPIEMPITNEPWGSREYHVRAPSGYILRFSGEIK